MIFLLPAVLAIWGLTSNRDGLVWAAIALFAWLSWGREKRARRTRLWSVPMTTQAIKVDEFGGRTTAPEGGGGSCGCA